MQPPPQAGEGQELTWAARVWVARSPDGRSTAQPVSLSQLARAFAKGLLPPEVEVAIDGEWIWENIRVVLARYAELAPPHAHDSGHYSDSFPQLELTLTVQKDALMPNLPAFPADAPLPNVTGPPRVTQTNTVPPSADAAPAARELLDFSFATPLPARLAPLIYGAAVLVAGLTLLGAVIYGLVTMVERLGEAYEARMVVLALLAGLSWIVCGAVAAGAIVLVGRAFAGLVLVARRIEEGLRDRR
jgi:hypothetical protein